MSDNRLHRTADSFAPDGRQHWKAGNMLYPLPVVLVSCQRPGERPNAVTVAWTGTVCTNPAMVYISLRPERYSYSIIRQTKEFVINLATESLARAVDYCGVVSGRQVDKFREMQLTAEPSIVVSPPGIAQSPVNLECQVDSVQELGSHHLFLARVVQVNVQESLLDSRGKLNLQEAGLIHYSHGEYFAQGDRIGGFGYSVRRRPEH